MRGEILITTTGACILRAVGCCQLLRVEIYKATIRLFVVEK